ncbi:ribbon-helix-helix domain-containing protein [Aurantimonas endophytica]|uniref:Antitoxin ParD1/3/4 n=1 Tax=Aurantimonas endophytica TaxID=1522175 RepID=A0A7W6MRY5_9HYPH|nr:type II toxin-antitoxin system ParD family antitoxin [Aurantimonas endophytica]MBB4005479.1 antitoxin ParD1/3/4 [Aurantimonas endophytica]MCO6405866.1 type II toxin-antitoxin system ParD family antitoxin [Aurantimonas endophytica]
MARSRSPLLVDLGSQRASLDAHLESGDFSDASDVVRAGLRALDREAAARDAVMKAAIEEALGDSRPSLPARDVFERLRRKQDVRDERTDRDPA